MALQRLKGVAEEAKIELSSTLEATISPPWKCTSCRASARWPRTTAPSAASSSRASPPALRGTTQIGVTFDVDANGILDISAADHATATEQPIRIGASGGLTEAETDLIYSEARTHAAEEQADVTDADYEVVNYGQEMGSPEAK